MMRVIWVAMVAVAAVVHDAAGQSFNIDIGAGTAPPASYGAAGLAGHWIEIPATQGVIYQNLVDIHGAVTAARLNQFGGTETLTIADAAVRAEHALLMNDCLITHTTIENCIFLAEMQPGAYDVLIYARMPAQPQVDALTNVDQEPGNPHHLVGGPWTGDHELGVSYAHHVANVAAAGSDAGRLWLHSGVPGGGDLGIGAALNGFQVRKRPLCAADIDGSGWIDAQDLVSVVLAWGACSGFCPDDVTGDGVVDVADLVAVVVAWGQCG
jgi:hypothetical protein